MDDTKEMSLVLRIKSYFGMTTAECRAEYSVLSQDDRHWFQHEFCAMGLPTTMKTS